MSTYPLLIGDRTLITAHPLEVRNPFDDTLVGTTYLAGRQELELAITMAEAAQDPLRAMPSHARAAALRQIADELRTRRDELALLLARESAKPLRYARTELERSAHTFHVAAEEATRLPAEVVQMDAAPAGEGRVGVVRYFPVGLVAGIAPFNFPINLVAHKVAPAIAAGCPIILKPASSTPLSAMELARIVQRTALPKGAVTVLPMDRETGNLLVTDPRFALLSFTGSPEVGWKMKEQAGKKKVVLELGGNAGVIITAGTDLDKALPRLLMGAFSYSGQVCIHAQRFFVHRSLFADFCRKMADGAAALKWGDPTDPTTDISTMIDRSNTARMAEWLAEAVAAGAQVVSGGFERDGIFAPTILTDVPREARVCAEEVFGPIITVEVFDAFSEAVEALNDSRFGLQAGVYTDSVAEMDMAFERIQCGGIILNDVPTFRADHMPYGGIKDSGLGREGVKYAMLDMLEPKLLVR